MKIKSFFASLATLVVAQFVLGTGYVHAYCIKLTNYCDNMEVNVDLSGNAYGLWNYTCDGVTFEEMLGQSGNSAIVAGALTTYAKTESWRINVPAKTLDIWQYLDGGATPPSLLIPANEPFTITGSSCGFGVPDTGASSQPSANQ